MTPNASILIVCFNNLPLTRACLERLIEVTPTDLYELVLVDNGSTDGTSAYLSRLADTLPADRFQLLTLPENLGFVGGNNAASRLARGRHLVFLNNDTLPGEGWLEGLLETMEQGPSVGAVGAKLIYPDGRLQEAGSRLFRDGTGYNYGKGGDAADPRYNYTREVDYCSGACLMVRRELFEELGGFDTRFAPAYCEDSDLCFSLRARGFRVLYQPRSHVVHVEGATAGRDLGAGFKKYQEINRPKFVAKWGCELASHPRPTQDPRVLNEESARGTGRRIFVYLDSPPPHDRAAGALRNFNFLRTLAAAGHHVTLAISHSHEFEGITLEGYVSELQQLGVLVWPLDRPGRSEGGDRLLVDRSRSMGEILSAIRHEVAYLPFHYCARWAMNFLKEHSPWTRLVVDSMDVHFVREARKHLKEGTPTTWAGYQRSRHEELSCYRSADRVLAVTEQDHRVLEQHLPAGRSFFLTDMHHLEPEVPGFEARENLVFVGGFRHTPNVDAVLHFHAHIWPHVRRLLPGVRWQIIGDHPPEEVRQLAGPGVEVTGWVPDLKPHLTRARVAVVPVRYGSGMKAKMVVGMGYGLPAVSTTAAAEGMELCDGREVLLAEDPESFAHAIHRLYLDPALWTRVSQAGRELVARRHGERAIFERLEAALGLDQEMFAERVEVLDELDLAREISTAYESFQAGGVEDAHARFLRCLGLAPRQAGILTGLALCEERLGRPERVEPLYALAFTCADRPAQVHLACGQYLERQGRTQEAVGHIQKAIHLEEHNPLPVVEAAQMARKYGNLAVAVRGYARAAELMPRDLWPLLRMAEVLTELGEMDAVLAVIQEVRIRAYGVEDRRQRRQVARLIRTVRSVTRSGAGNPRAAGLAAQAA